MGAWLLFKIALSYNKKRKVEGVMLRMLLAFFTTAVRPARTRAVVSEEPVT